jgi:hypothetical protein
MHLLTCRDLAIWFLNRSMQVGHRGWIPCSRWRCVCSSRLLSDIAPCTLHSNRGLQAQPHNSPASHPSSVVAGCTRLHMVGHRDDVVVLHVEPTLCRCRVTQVAHTGFRVRVRGILAPHTPMTDLATSSLCGISAWHSSAAASASGRSQPGTSNGAPVLIAGCTQVVSLSHSCGPVVGYEGCQERHRIHVPLTIAMVRFRVCCDSGLQHGTRIFDRCCSPSTVITRQGRLRSALFTEARQFQDIRNLSGHRQKNEGHCQTP